MEETLNQLVSDIYVLKWLLGGVSLFLLIVTGMLIFAFRMLILAVKNTELRAESRMFQEQAETMMEQGKNESLKSLADARINDAPSDAWGHYYYGTALYRLNELVMAKQSFVKAGKLNPQFKTNSDQSIEEIDNLLSESKPELV